MASSIGAIGPRAEFFSPAQDSARQQNNATRPQLVDQRELPLPRVSLPPSSVGFGRDSISTPGLALATIGTNIESARRTVPSIEEQFEARREALDAAIQEQGLDAEAGAARVDAARAASAPEAVTAPQAASAPAGESSPAPDSVSPSGAPNGSVGTLLNVLV